MKKSKVIVAGTNNLRKCNKCGKYFVQMKGGRPYCEPCFYSMEEDRYEREE